MIGTLFAFAGMAGLRLALWGGALGLWLLTRPGGWAVLAVALLVGVKLLPAPTP
ncbi:hypothetical protein [Phaeovulum sp. NW3]|uniref:hypothetical protein n=1 Tax=Phaeovulum sp. NW3 TaxID=2934933 RepID=UPI00202192AB|nr:hypothetical protein [Phaeovulum sp. NW3]MCL7464193.1 hypothetical protein [Phaeovulum sp. NW3]